MEKHKTAAVCEIDHADKNWMIQLGRLSRVADRVVLKNFTPNCSSIGYVKTISSDNNFFVQSWNTDLILEKRASIF